MLEAIINIIYEKELAFFHYFVITVTGGLAIMIIAKLTLSILVALKSIPFFKKITKVIRYMTNKMDINDFINIDERIKNGGKLKRYEKKGYVFWKQQEQEAKPKLTQKYLPVYRDYGDRDQGPERQ